MERTIRQAQTGGSSLPARIRRTLEPKLGADLSNVKIHTDSRAAKLARDLNAKAFTHKNHIFFGAGHSPNDLKLTAHEAVHTIQQGAVRRMPVQRTRDRNAKDGQTGDSPATGVPSIQRLITSSELRSLAGEPHKDRKLFGFTLWKMSTAYKRVLHALDIYHGRLTGLPTQEPGGIGFFDDALPRLNRWLDELRDELQRYVDSHSDDTVRTPIIRDIITNGIPKERALATQIAQNPGPYLGKSFADALAIAEMSPIANTVINMMQSASARELRDIDQKEQEAAQKENRQAKSAVAGLTGTALKNKALEYYEDEMEQASEEGKKEVTSFNFRGNSPATKLGTAMGADSLRPYISSILMPALREATHIPDNMIEIDPVKLTTKEDKARLGANINRLKRLYRNFMSVFSAERAKQVPKPFAEFCAELYDTASKHMSAEHAYLLVSSQIFLRGINPVLTYATAAIPMGQPGRRALVLLAKLAQHDANNMPHGQSNEPYFKVMGDMSYIAQLREFVFGVLAHGRE